MRKACLLIFLLVFSCTLFAELKVNLGPVKSTKEIKLTYQEQDVSLTERINSLTFAMPFCERLVFGTGVYKYLSYDDLVKTATSIYSVINNGAAATMTIKDYKDGKDLIFNFHYKHKGTEKMILCTSNFAANTGEIVGQDRLGETWAMAYHLIGDKLVNYSYVTGKDKNPPEVKPLISLGNYYLQNSDKKDDALIERLILKGIKTDENPNLPIAYSILSQYYMLVNDLNKAKTAFAYIMKVKETGKGVSRDEVYYITSMELDVVKKCNEW